MNSVQFTGRVVKDATLSVYQGDLKVTNFTVVVNRDRKNGDQWEEKPVFVDLALFGKAAESYLPHLTKGKVVGVEAHLDMDNWEKDGKKYSKLKVSCDRIFPFIAGGAKKTGEAEVPPSEFAGSDAFEDCQPVNNGEAIF